MSKIKKLMLIGDITSALKTEGVTLTPNAVRSRLRNAMLLLAEKSSKALGADVASEELERVAGSRSFQEAIAQMIKDDD